MFGFCASGIIARLIIAAALPLFVRDISHAAVASIHGGSDGLCGHRTADGERLNCSAMTALIGPSHLARTLWSHSAYVTGASTIADRGCEAGNVTISIRQ